MKRIGNWFLIESGEATIWVDDHETANLVSGLVNRPMSPRAQIVQIIEDLVSSGFTRPEAIDHVLKDRAYYELLMKARKRRSKNPTATRQTIYNWLREYNK